MLLAKNPPLDFSIEESDLISHICRQISMAVEKKLAEEALGESEEKYRAIVERSPDGIATIDLKGVITSCNRAALEIGGYPEQEIVGRHFSKLKFLHMKDIPKYLQIFRDAIKGRASRPIEIELQQKKKNLVWVEIRIGFLKQGKKVNGLQIIARDVTERKKAENDLRFLSKTAMELVEFPLEGNIYKYLAEGLKTLLGDDSVVAVNSFDNDRSIITTEIILGIDNSLAMIEKVLGKKPAGMSVNLTADEKKKMMRRKTIHEEEGLYELALGKLPKAVCSALEKLFNVNSIYSMGFTRGNDFLSSASVILLKQNTLGNKGTIEAFLNQAATVLQRRKAEEQYLLREKS
jgi:PAS domain S-box-containing protein